MNFSQFDALQYAYGCEITCNDVKFDVEFE